MQEVRAGVRRALCGIYGNIFFLHARALQAQSTIPSSEHQEYTQSSYFFHFLSPLRFCIRAGGILKLRADNGSLAWFRVRGSAVLESESSTSSEASTESPETVD